MPTINSYPNDLTNLLGKLTARRAHNIVKVWQSYHLSRLSGNPVHSGMPISISIEPTTSCNLRCPECPSGLRAFTRPTGMLDPQLFRKIIDEISRDLLYLTFYFQGEPYLNPAFLDMVEYASMKKIYTATSTNAHFLDPEHARLTVASGLDRLIISIDGADQEVYQQYRVGGSLDKVLEGARQIVYWKKKLRSKKPFLAFQFLVVHPNEHQIKKVKLLAKEIGIDKVVLKTAQVYDFENGNPLIPLNDKYSRYSKQPDGKYKIKNNLLNHCWKLWHSSVITWDGRVIPCCFDKDASYQMGNVSLQTFGEIWQGKPYQDFRASLLKSRNEIDICTNCTEGTRVWA